jgi:hypothetical protein
MELKTDEKIFLITMEGFLTLNESISYIGELRKNIRKFNPSKYSLVIDAKELKASPQRSIGMMEEAMKIITTIPFKNKYSITPESLIAASQIKRVGRGNDKFCEMIFVESYEEVLGLAG